MNGRKSPRSRPHLPDHLCWETSLGKFPIKPHWVQFRSPGLRFHRAGARRGVWKKIQSHPDLRMGYLGGSNQGRRMPGEMQIGNSLGIRIWLQAVLKKILKNHVLDKPYIPEQWRDDLPLLGIMEVLMALPSCFSRGWCLSHLVGKWFRRGSPSVNLTGIEEKNFAKVCRFLVFRSFIGIVWK